MTEEKKKRGFAALKERDPGRLAEICSAGGKGAHAKGTAHEFTPEEARAAGRKGGLAVAQNRAHMAAIGREGGKRPHSPKTLPSPPPSSTVGADEEE